MKGRAILGGTKGVEVHRRSAERETNVVSEGSSHLPSIFPLTDSKTANEWTRRGRTHPIQRSHTHAPSALSVLDEKFVPHTVGTCLNYSLFKRETKKGMREEEEGGAASGKGGRD